MRTPIEEVEAVFDQLKDMVKEDDTALIMLPGAFGSYDIYKVSAKVMRNLLRYGGDALNPRPEEDK